MPNDIITSTKNQIVSKVVDIKKSPSGSIFLEGHRLVFEGLSFGLEPTFFLIEESIFDEIKSSHKEILSYPYYVLSKNVFEKICDTKTPQGLAMVAKFDLTSKNMVDGNFLVLDNLQDPGNLGTIIRSASGTSFRNIFLINCTSPLSQKVVRSTMGGLFRENFVTFDSTDEFIAFAKENNLTFFCATMEGQNVFEFEMPQGRIGIVIGNEGNGVSDELKTKAKGLLAIPMKNNLESLNAAVSAGILMYCIDNKKC